MSLPRVMPVTLMVASLTSVILPSGLIVTRGSRDASIRLLAYWEACFCSSSVKFARSFGGFPGSLFFFISAAPPLQKTSEFGGHNTVFLSRLGQKARHVYAVETLEFAPNLFEVCFHINCVPFI